MKDRLGALPAVASASEPVAVADRTKGLDKWTVCVCLFCGTYYTLAGMLLFFVPRFFFTKLAPFAPYNEHYMVDLGSFLLPVGLFLLLAVRYPRWSTPIMGLAALGSSLHLVSHLRDGLHTSGAVLGDAFFLAVALLLIAPLITRKSVIGPVSGLEGGTRNETSRFWNPVGHLDH